MCVWDWWRDWLGSPPMFVHCCHCRDCQRQTGSAFALNALIEADRVSLLSGNAEPIAVPTPSGKPHEIYRCLVLPGGSSGASMAACKSWRFVRVGTLDDAAGLKPDVHIYVRSKLPWVTLPENVPAFDSDHTCASFGRPKASSGAGRFSAKSRDPQIEGRSRRSRATSHTF